MLSCSNYTQFLLSPHNPSLPSFTPSTTNPVFIAITSLQECSYKLNHTVCNLFGLAFFPLRIVLWRFIQVSACNKGLFLFIAEWYFTVWVYPIFWSTIHWRTDRLPPSAALVDQGTTNMPWTRSCSGQDHALIHSSHLPRKTTLEVILIWF